MSACFKRIHVTCEPETVARFLPRAHTLSDAQTQNCLPPPPSLPPSPPPSPPRGAVQVKDEAAELFELIAKLVTGKLVPAVEAKGQLID